MDFNWLAIIALAFIALSTIHGVIRGFHRCLVDFIFLWGVALTFIFGFRLAYELAGSIAEDEIIRTLTAGIGLLIAAVAFFGVLSEMVLKSDLNQAIGSRINSGLGMVYGLIRGLFIIVLAWLVFTSLASDNLVNQARKKLPGDLLDTLSNSLWEIFPATLGERAEEIKDQVVKQTEAGTNLLEN